MCWAHLQRIELLFYYSCIKLLNMAVMRNYHKILRHTIIPNSVRVVLSRVISAAAILLMVSGTHPLNTVLSTICQQLNIRFIFLYRFTPFLVSRVKMFLAKQLLFHISFLFLGGDVRCHIWI